MWLYAGNFQKFFEILYTLRGRFKALLSLGRIGIFFCIFGLFLPFFAQMSKNLSKNAFFHIFPPVGEKNFFSFLPLDPPPTAIESWITNHFGPACANCRKPTFCNKKDNQAKIFPDSSTLNILSIYFLEGKRVFLIFHYCLGWTEHRTRSKFGINDPRRFWI